MKQIIKTTKTIKELQDLVDSGIWKGQPDIEWAIWDRLLELCEEQGLKQVPDFGAPGFLQDLYDDDEEERWVTLDEFRQQGGNQAMVDQQRNANNNWQDHCTISEEFKQKIKRFNVEGTAYQVSFKDMEEVDDVGEMMKGMFDGLLQRGDVEEDDLVGFELKHPKLDTSILIPFRKKDEHTVEHITRTIEKVVQSNEDLELDDGLVCKVTKIRQPRGEGKKRNLNSVDDFLSNHKCVIDVPGHDGLCLPRALVTAKAQVDNDSQWNTVRRGDGSNGRCKVQLNRAKELMQQAGLQDHVGAWGLREIQTFQNILSPNYQIKIFEKASCDGLVFSGPPADKVLNLVLHEEHFMVISKMNAFLGNSYYCELCNVTYSHREDHRCVKVCHCCFVEDCTGVLLDVTCNDCNRWFRGAACYDQHKQQVQARVGNKMVAKAVCDNIKRCKDCGMEYRTRRGVHECNKSYCKFCKEKVMKGGGHQCYMAQYKPKDGQAKGYIFFDFETQQTKCVGENKYGSIFHHEPVCVVVHKVCVECWKERDMSIHCNTCQTRKRVFLGPDVLDSFVKWLFSEENRDCIAMAHNNKGYDCQFILESLHRNAMECPDVIFKGLEIMKLKLNGVTLLDSLCFLPMPLSAIPGAFGLVELKKGYFPHFFTDLSNWNYKGPLPDAYFYGPALMKQKAKESFYKWYIGVTNQEHVFDFKKELLDYCNSDVDILKMGVMQFRETFMEKTGLDPYWNSMTISDACMKVFRSRYLLSGSIGLLPMGEYRANDRYSAIGLKWLRWRMQEDGVQIQHARNGGEVVVVAGGHRYRADGLSGNTVYEFNGCAFHGCPKCFDGNTLLPLSGRLAKEAYGKTLDRKADLERVGYKVVDLWECDLRHELLQNTTMRDFFKSQNIMEPLRARDAYFGGRTNCTTLYKTLEQAGHSMQYIDICSLYPYVLKYGVFPCGHPEIITENFEDMNRSNSKPYQGLIKCRVLAPRAMYHPVLPMRAHGKLMFALCGSCVQHKHRGPCAHTPDERSFWGTWVTLEVYKAVERGYKVLEIAEVWNYGDNVKQYKAGGDVSDGLFTEYIDEFLKMKQEASDWPKSCETDGQKEEYLREYAHHEGIALDSDNIKKNPALRALAKLCLNSFYGKFGQRNTMPKTTHCNDPKAFFELLADNSKEVRSVRAFNDKMVQVTYVQADGFEDELPSVNVVVAAYVTAQARLELYSYLEQLQENVLYFDTDSIIYYHRPPMPLIETGSYLGNMTNELEDFGKGAYIQEFVSAGPKNYAFAVHCPDGSVKHVVKIRGFTLDSVTSKRLNMRTLKRKVQAFVRGGFQEKTVVVMPKIERTKEGHVRTVYKSKTYTVVVDKRWVDTDFVSYPYGF